MEADPAFSALRRAGLRFDDPDLVKLFPGNPADPDFVVRAKTAKPDMFNFDARSAPAVEVDARLKEIERAEWRKNHEGRTAATIAALRAEYAPKGP